MVPGCHDPNDTPNYDPDPNPNPIPTLSLPLTLAKRCRTEIDRICGPRWVPNAAYFGWDRGVGWKVARVRQHGHL